LQTVTTIYLKLSKLCSKYCRSIFPGHVVVIIVLHETLAYREYVRLSVPSPAHDVVVDPKHLGELHISWYPPLKPNGQVTHYYVYWHPQPFHAEKYHQRNYCDDSKSVHAVVSLLNKLGQLMSYVCDFMMSLV